MNIIFLTVDALRADRCSVNGYSRPTTPNLERLVARGINCTQAIAPGAFTHISFPSIMTSSRPLSYGGYDTGATGRPDSIFKKAREANLHVSAYCTTHWVCRYHGYGGDIDDEQLLFSLNTLPGTALALFRSTLALWHSGKISDAEVVATAERTIGVFFDNMIDYCQERIQRATSDDLNYKSERFVTDGYQYDKVISLVHRHREEFHRDVLAYLKRHMYYVPKAHQWIGKEWRRLRSTNAIFRLSMNMLSERVGAFFGTSNHKFAQHRQKRYVDGATVTQQIISSIDKSDGNKPFFIWNHYQDTHIPYCAGTGLNWFQQTKDYLKVLGYGSEIDVSVAIGGKPETEEEWSAWSALYDASVMYADEQIGRVVDALEAKGILDDTLIIICGDHGEELGDHGDISHHFRLYSHNVRIPLLFCHPSLSSGSNDTLVELTDIAPTIAASLGLELDPDWVGAPIWDDAVKDRKSVVIESFFGGNCTFETRPLYMSARDKKWNFMWKEFRDPEDKLSPEGPQLYNHALDPLEQNNLYAEDHPEIPRLSMDIINRLRSISEISDERIARAFPKLCKNKDTQ
ncbi:sulfatase-like hydrolase/transferase [Rhodospirillales bacterium]|nr:sulfatase-like hydrolase/transferase [Rhodospirillales bacterium]